MPKDNAASNVVPIWEGVTKKQADPTRIDQAAARRGIAKCRAALAKVRLKAVAGDE